MAPGGDRDKEQDNRGKGRFCTKSGEAATFRATRGGERIDPGRLLVVRTGPAPQGGGGLMPGRTNSRGRPRQSTTSAGGEGSASTAARGSSDFRVTEDASVSTQGVRRW